MDHQHQHSCSFPSVDPSYTSDPAHLPPRHDKEYQGKPVLASIASSIDSLSPGLRDVSLKMHDNPEICWKEFQTSDLLASYMESQGFTLKRNAYGTETGFEAVFSNGDGGKVIGFNSEMDALPAIGHACGHNLIAIAGLGAAVATARALVEHNIPGKVILLGTPAEEADGGKCVMLKNGAYKDMDVCLMAHPTPLTGLAPMLAVTECLVEFFGHTAHAGGAPWEGVNALDAAVLAYQNIAVLRQQIHPLHRVHGVIMGSEEWACNVIPGHSKLKFGIRHPQMSEVLKLKKRIESCFAAAAEASGCTHTVKWVMQYADMQNNSVLAGEFKRYMEEEEGWHVPIVKDAFGSTDFGDVTYALPSLHPLYAIPVRSSADANHTAGFEKASATLEAHESTMKVAKGLAATAWRIVADESFAAAAQHEYLTVRKSQKTF